MKGIDKFADAFWKFIKEEVGVSYIYPEQKSYLKKKLSFEERQARIDKMIDKVEFEDDKLSQSEMQLLKWSEEAVILSTYVKKLGLMPDMCVEDYMLDFFVNLNFQHLGIKNLDETLLRMTHLQVLNLSFNKIGSLNYVPKNLRELYLAGNQIERIDCS
eukprot:CAMPEP_0202972008 /NCGR_PEP_ID=MMETSP1396-20130829/32529_1 /ASSEMBLY_ACC=CAM_ASM_000872 /TAXON_ID= /ORGANISM="Pseudokeronopsis sp., Strain Brazil" /LENGTH=158 /DNA_ID=CAMNT_0049701977 /DNA_START=60 /DNA_END=536 /DNA_ORIENTATION=+